MPTFYFHVCDGLGFCEDPEGRELPDFETAKAEAIAGLRDTLAGDLKNGEINLAAFIEIEDHNHQLLATISAEQVVHIRRDLGPERSR